MKIIGVVVIGLLFIGRLSTVPSDTFKKYQSLIPISKDEMETMIYIREKLPQDTVILQNRFITYLYTAITGRAVYYDSPPVDLEKFMNKKNSGRFEKINQLWAAKDKNQFCTLLKTMRPATHIVSYESLNPNEAYYAPPLKVHDPNCLKLLYASSHSSIKLYEIITSH